MDEKLKKELDQMLGVKFAQAFGSATETTLAGVVAMAEGYERIGQAVTSAVILDHSLALLNSLDETSVENFERKLDQARESIGIAKAKADAKAGGK